MGAAYEMERSVEDAEDGIPPPERAEQGGPVVLVRRIGEEGGADSGRPGFPGKERTRGRGCFADSRPAAAGEEAAVKPVVAAKPGTTTARR